MKTLFVTEPFTIRGHWTVTEWIAERYANIVNSSNHNFECALFCNRTLRSRFIDQGLTSKSVFSFTKEEAVLGFSSRWNSSDIKRWSDYLSGIGPASGAIKNRLARIQETFDFDLLVIWGSNRSISDYAATSGVATAFCELGPLRPPYGFWGAIDPRGVNGDGSLVDIPLSQLIDDDRNLMFETFEKKPNKISVILQNSDDSNVLIHKGPIGYVDFIIDAVARASLLDCSVDICPHPGADRYVHTFKAQTEMVDCLLRYPGVRISTEETHSTISKSDLVVTYNSSVGYEGLRMGKPVVIGGRASYSPRGLSPSLDALERQISINNTVASKYHQLMESYFVDFERLFDLETIKNRSIVESIRMF